jgi:hypothetical protein
MSIITNARTRLATVGVEILVGESLASNLFIGALLYVHLQSSDTVAGPDIILMNWTLQ